jgi:hypothetical protein
MKNRYLKSNKMKYTILTLAVLFFLFTATAQTNDDDAVYEKLIREYTLEQDGSTSFREYKELKLLTHFSFNRLYGETFIIYNPEFQQLTINEAYTIMADGTRIETPENAFNEVLPRNAASSATYNHLREMVVTHTGLEIGATIYLDYTLTSSKDFLPGLMGNEIIQESSPVKQMEVIVNVPPDIELNHRMLGLRTAPEVMIIGSHKVYTWKFGGLAASSKERLRGSDLPGAPRLMFSSLENLNQMTGWFTKQNAFSMQLNEAMKNAVDSIRQKEEDEIKTLMAIRKDVADKMVDDRVDISWTGYRLRNPTEVWKSNGGSKLEKSVLMAALLQHADFSVTPALVASRWLFNPDAPSLKLIDDIVLIVNTKGYGTLYLSATGSQHQSLEYDLADKVLIPLSTKHDAVILEPEEIRNEISVNATIVITDSLKLTGRIEMELYGAANPFLTLHNNKAGIKSHLAGGLVKEDDAIEVVNSNTAKSTISLKAARNEPFGEAEGYYRWMLPAMTNGFDRWQISYLESSRTDPLVLPFPITEKYTFNIELPSGYTFVNTRISNKIKSNAGSVNIQMRPRGNTIEIIRELDITDTTVLPTDYADFRSMMNMWLNQNFRMLVIKEL